MSNIRIPHIVRPLTPADMSAFVQLCEQNPFRYLTPRLNIEVYGFDSESVRAWGAFTQDSLQMHGIMLRYSNTAIIADQDGSTAAAFAALIDSEQGLAGIRGSKEIVHKMRSSLQRYTPTGLESSMYLELTAPPEIPASTLRLARRADLTDLDMLAELYGAANAMYRSRTNVATKLAETRVFVAEEPLIGKRPRRIVSCALLNMEGSTAGLIGGVYTLPAARGHGYAAACTAALSIDLQQDGKLPTLFYENPIAGRVYRRMGYRDVDEWAVLYIARQGR